MWIFLTGFNWRSFACVLVTENLLRSLGLLWVFSFIVGIFCIKSKHIISVYLLRIVLFIFWGGGLLNQVSFPFASSIPVCLLLESFFLVKEPVCRGLTWFFKKLKWMYAIVSWCFPILYFLKSCCLQVHAYVSYLNLFRLLIVSSCYFSIQHFRSVLSTFILTRKFFCVFCLLFLVYFCAFSSNMSVDFSFVILECPVLFVLFEPLSEPFRFFIFCQ